MGMVAETGGKVGIAIALGLGFGLMARDGYVVATVIGVALGLTVRFRYEVVGTVFDCLYCHFHCCVRGKYDDDYARIHLFYFFKSLESVFAGHIHVENDDVVSALARRSKFDLLESVHAIKGFFDRVFFNAF